MNTSETMLAEILEERLRTKIRLPEISALAQPAALAYRAGWEQAADVSRNNPNTHTADRSQTMPDTRMKNVLKALPKTGAGRLSGAQYRTEQTVQEYAARGYRDCMEQAALLGWRDFLQSNPQQAAGEMLERRITYLEKSYNYGSASGNTDRNLDYLPRTRSGRQWMIARARMDLDQMGLRRTAAGNETQKTSDANSI